MGDWPLRSRAIFSSSTSMQTTEWPESAKQTPATSPTYPVPTTAIRMRGFYTRRTSKPQQISRSLHGDRFRQVARLVDVRPAVIGDVVAEELRRDHRDD